MIYLRNIAKSTLLTNVPVRYFCSDDDFKKTTKIQVTNENAQQLIKKWVNDYDVVLFMKGTPQQPRCGYSASVVELLKKYGTNQLI
jgi:hypothetical protein